MARHAEVAVIGGGPAGYPAAIRAAQLGKAVLLIEKHKLGGECLNYGCIPSKALIHTANIVDAIGRAKEWGVDAGPVRVDMAKLQGWKASVVDRLVTGIGQLLKGNRVDVLWGDVSFRGAQVLEVRLQGGGYEEVTFDHAIVATGGRPSDLPAVRFDGTRVISTKEALELPTVPADLLVVGGGVSGLEIACMYAKLGSKVVVVEILDQLLPGTDPEAVRLLARRLKRLDIRAHVRSEVKAWREEGGKASVDVATPEGAVQVRADVILVAVGRRPNTDGLHLDRAGVTLDAKGHVVVDRQMRTANPRIFAAGDVIGPPFLAHKATREGQIAAEALSGKAAEADYRALPAAIFTDPEIATVGLQEHQAGDRAVRTAKVPFAAIGRALTAGDPDGFVKLIVDVSSNALLGGTIVGPGASDLISELALAIEMGATAEDIAMTIHPHPTFPEGIMETAEAALGRAVHVLNR